MTPLRVLSLGWGVQSWTIAAMTALGELPPLDYAVHASTFDGKATRKFAAEHTPWLRERGVNVVEVRLAPEDLVEAVVPPQWSDSVMIPAFTRSIEGADGQMKRQCTSLWKIRATRQFARSKVTSIRVGAIEQVMGISLDEWQRMRDSDVQYIVNTYPLVEARVKRADCILWLQRNGLPVPPKSACVFCPFHTAKQWKAMKREGGEDWEIAVAADKAIRATAEAHGHQLYVHSARVPLAEAVKIPEDEGASQAQMQICDSGYCWD